MVSIEHFPFVQSTFRAHSEAANVILAPNILPRRQIIFFLPAKATLEGLCESRKVGRNFCK